MDRRSLLNVLCCVLKGDSNKTLVNKLCRSYLLLVQNVCCMLPSCESLCVYQWDRCQTITLRF